MKLFADVIIIANINDCSYCKLTNSVKRYTNNNCKIAPKELIPINIPYCHNKCFNVKFLSIKVHTLFIMKLECIENMIPTTVPSR